MFIVSKAKYSVYIIDGKMTMHIQNSNGINISNTGNILIADGNWHLATLVYNRNGNASIYVDGILDTQTDISQLVNTIIISNSPVRIGASVLLDNTTPEHYYRGKLNSIRVYNRTLSEQEIYELYNRSIYTIRVDGRYDGAIAVEGSTDNLLALSSWTTNGTKGIDSTYQLRYPVVPEICSHVASGNDMYLFSVQLNDLVLADGSSITCSGWFYVKGAVGKFNCKLNDNIDSNRTIGEVHSRTRGWWYLTWSFTNETGANITLNSVRVNTSFITDWPNNDNEAWGCNYQVEMKSYATSFINGSRERGIVAYKNPLENIESGTVSCFAKKLAGHKSGGPIISICSSTSNSNSLHINVFYDKVSFLIYDNDGVGWIADSLLPIDDMWHMYTIKFDGRYVYGYVDGVNVAIREYLYSGFSPSGYLRLGQRIFAGMSPNKFGDFLIDELRIDKAAKTDEEILSWYLSNCPFYGRGSERVVL
jgi:hypothetical protein